MLQFIVGAAHGLSSILQMLLSCGEFMKSDPDAARDVRASVDFMLSLMQPNGNIAPAMDEVGPRARQRPASEELVHWCHGAPGNRANFTQSADAKYGQMKLHSMTEQWDLFCIAVYV